LWRLVPVIRAFRQHPAKQLKYWLGEVRQLIKWRRFNYLRDHYLSH